MQRDPLMELQITLLLLLIVSREWVVECAQLLESTVYHTELSLLHIMRYNLSQSLQLIGTLVGLLFIFCIVTCTGHSWVYTPISWLSQAHAARSTDGASDNTAAVADCIERMIVVEECAQLLESTVYHTELSLLHTMRYNLSQSLRLIVYGVDEHTVPPIALYTICSGLRGRPRIVINVEYVELLRSCGYTWNEVADALQVSRSTIWRRLKEAGIHLQRYSDISDHELDSIVERFQRENPNYGQQFLLGHLKAQGIYVQRHRLREYVQRIDPIRRHLRWQEAISRCTYCVQNSNALWHIDGHHSLIRWRFVVHGGIDGYSRVMYLPCSTNNKAMTVYHLFWKAIEEFGCPSRVRSDKGGENIKVCPFMVSVEVAEVVTLQDPLCTIRGLNVCRDIYHCVQCTISFFTKWKH